MVNSEIGRHLEGKIIVIQHFNRLNYCYPTSHYQGPVVRKAESKIQWIVIFWKCKSFIHPCNNKFWLIFIDWRLWYLVRYPKQTFRHIHKSWKKSQSNKQRNCFNLIDCKRKSWGFNVLARNQYIMRETLRFHFGDETLIPRTVCYDWESEGND